MSFFTKKRTLASANLTTLNNYHVALIVETSNEYARGLLRGIQSYLKEHRPWSIYLSEQGRDHLDWTWLSDWKGKGIIARIETPEMALFLKNLGLPTVNLSSTQAIPGIPCVETDDEAIAKMAAHHLLERGYKHFAYCGNSNYTWSQLRSKHFVEIMHQNGFSCSILDTANMASASSIDLRDTLIDWVQSLPVPVGIMACYDALGQQILEACRLAGLTAAEEVGVIGVDNDQLLCELSTPSLTSVGPNSMKTGYVAASLLDQMMAGKEVQDGMHLIKPIDVKRRASTDRIAVNDPLVSNALQFIRHHEFEHINVHDLLQVFPVSRRVLENRFRKELGRTPHEEIVQVKINLIKRLLVETELSMHEIATRIGFTHPEYMNVLFKREIGESPGKYRSRYT